ncbi:MAG TPA: hypothetical protein VE999_03675 [Gemmataceae bacterium]|nr:hypothetical protein [Gemmataceae bacterium]
MSSCQMDSEAFGNFLDEVQNGIGLRRKKFDIFSQFFKRQRKSDLIHVHSTIAKEVAIAYQPLRPLLPFHSQAAAARPRRHDDTCRDIVDMRFALSSCPPEQGEAGPVWPAKTGRPENSAKNIGRRVAVIVWSGSKAIRLQKQTRIVDKEKIGVTNYCEIGILLVEKRRDLVAMWRSFDDGRCWRYLHALLCGPVGHIVWNGTYRISDATKPIGRQVSARTHYP